jgi:hypothetical protein
MSKTDMYINSLMKEKLQDKDKTDIVKQMGYHSVSKGIESLDKLLSKGFYDFMLQGMYDFKYTAEPFIRKLCKVLEIDDKLIDKEIKKAKAIKAEKESWAHTYIYVNTNFHRAQQQIFVLALLEGTRRIRLKEEHLLFKSDEYVFKKVSEAVQTHYRDNDGKLPIWGRIANYVYHHKDGKTYVFDTNGKLTDEEVCETEATLSVR